ncbi:hypothetical protein FEM48_Zijuj03G0146600 [Ziziphus jujuba var. spinosa]|uniref:Alpha/beta hydrolase fold-3 domain-containing protein n=1 Tax=Ziziphus jujuba var. spinosa TaxID=714518 RepID=A0A978VQW9_ZIZJJ|nr:hypothetical protein FEM48_Zijuj03G0146600 [Ziziphus jujuba var. spinosa]
MSSSGQNPPSDSSKPSQPLLLPSSPAEPDPSTATSSVLSKDIPLNPTNQTFVRLFLPRKTLEGYSSSTTNQKLPLIFYYHGGGFVRLSATSTPFHVFCSNMALHLQAIIVSVEYRLAPQHRLPAAYDDAVEALHWIKTTHEDWISKFADLSSCFLMGTSAGGNIAYHAAIRAFEEDLGPLIIRGLLLHHPFFGGAERTGSELRMENDQFLPLHASDQAWKLSLPVGANRDHEYCCAVAGAGSDRCDRILKMGWRVFVAGCYGDPLIDRQMELVKMFEGKGIETVTYYSEGNHGLEITEPSKAHYLFLALKCFISG